MKKFKNEEFHRSIDRGGGDYSDCHFISCQFVNGGFSLTDQVAKISRAQDMLFDGCHVCETDVGPSVLENIQVSDLSTDELFILWSPFLRHVTFRGKNGRVKINSTYSCVDFHPKIQEQFAAQRVRFYKETDWALDISEARFQEFEVNGVPAELIKVDPERHFVFTRERALQIAWHDKLRRRDNYWAGVVDDLVREGETSTVLVVSEELSQKEYSEESDCLKELRDLGVLT